MIQMQTEWQTYEYVGGVTFIDTDTCRKAKA